MRKRLFSTAGIILLAICPSLLMAAPAPAKIRMLSPKKCRIKIITLKDAVFLALRNNPDVRSAEIQRIADKFALVLAKNQFQPQYTLTGSAQYVYATSGGSRSITRQYTASPSVALENHYGTQFSVASANPWGPGGHYNPSLTLQIIQPLIQGFGKPVVDAALNNAKDTEIINRLTFKGQAITTITTVINDYLAFVQAYQQHKADDAVLKSSEQTVNKTKLLIKAGKIAGSAIVQAKSSVATQKITAEEDTNAIDTTRNTLLNDLGLPPKAMIYPPKKFDYKKLVSLLKANTMLPDLKTSEKIGIQNNIAYQTALITVRTLIRSVMTAKDARRWTLNLTAQEVRGGGSGGGRNAGTASLINNRNYSSEADLNLTVPIDDVGQQNAVVDSEVALEQERIALQETYRSLVEQVDTDYHTIKSNWRQLVLSRQAFALQLKTYHINQQQFLMGTISNFQLATVLKTLNTDTLAVISNQISYLDSIADYEENLGVSLEPWHVKVRY
jgi:outer membrane protein